MRQKKYFISLIIIGLTSILFAQSHPTAHDIAAMNRVSNVRFSPDGTWLTYLLETNTFDSTASPSDGDYLGGWNTDRQLYMISAKGDNLRQLTSGSKVSAPEWSPDGKTIAFLREDSGFEKIFLLSTNSTEAQPLALNDLEPQAFKWSPDGNRIAFTATLPVDSLQKEKKWQSGGVIEWDEEWQSDKLFIVNLSDNTVTQISRSKEHIINFDWSPDGTQFAVTVSQSSDPYLTYTMQLPLIISADNGAPIHLLEAVPRVIGNIKWSPDGRYVAYTTPDNSPSVMRLLRVHEVGTTNLWNAAASLDPTIMNFIWTNDSQSLITHVYEKTISKLYQLPVNGESYIDMGFSRGVIAGDLQLDNSRNQLAFLSSTFDSPNDLTLFEIDLAKTNIVIQSNPRAAEWTHGKQEIIRWINPDGVALEGLLASPAKSKTDNITPPLMVFPHGGPDWLSNESFNGWITYFVAQGYAVFRPNYRGGIGYGYDFYTANRGRLGDIEEMDIESGVYHLLATKRADPEKLLIGGWSWGGFLTTWSISHYDNYKAAVVGAGVSDVTNQYVTSDINHGLVAWWEFKSNPWVRPENFDRVNPLRLAKNITTPTLIFHGQSDTRVDFVQGQSLYRALKDVRCEVKFYAYPREPHSFEEPAHIAHMLQAWADWYKTHLEL